MKPRLPQISIAIAACLYAALASAEVQLLPAGQFASRDGRPGPGKAWRLDDAQGRELAERMNARPTPFVIDYEHQTINAADNGQPAPAAAWASKFEWRNGVGLFALGVEWTRRAQQMIDAQEYRFISPVIVFDEKTGVVRDVLNAALTNFPALEGMAEVAARLAAQLNSQEEHSMNPLLQKLLAALGLSSDTGEDTALTAVTSLKAKADEHASLHTKLAAAQGELSTLKAKPVGTDPEALKAMNTLQTTVADLQSKLATRDLDDVVAAALKAGKLVPAQEKWARDIGGKDLLALKTYIETAPAVSALGGRQSGDRAVAASSNNAQVIADAALKYQREQATAGVNVSTAQAVAHVQQKAA